MVAFQGLPILPPGAGLNVTSASVNTDICLAIGAAPEAVHEPFRLNHRAFGHRGQPEIVANHLLDRRHPRAGEILGVLRNQGLHQPADQAAARRTRPKDGARLDDRTGDGGYRTATSCHRPGRHPVDGRPHQRHRRAQCSRRGRNRRLHRLFIASVPRHVNLTEITILPTQQAV